MFYTAEIPCSFRTKVEASDKTGAVLSISLYCNQKRKIVLISRIAARHRIGNSRKRSEDFPLMLASTTGGQTRELIESGLEFPRNAITFQGESFQSFKNRDFSYKTREYMTKNTLLFITPCICTLVLSSNHVN